MFDEAYKKVMIIKDENSILKNVAKKHNCGKEKFKAIESLEIKVCNYYNV